MVVYEQLLNGDPSWALQEGSMHFDKESAVHEALEKIARRLREHNIPYVIVGGMAMFFHGYRRFTEDVNVLVTAEGLEQIHRELDGLGYVRMVPGGRNLRDAEYGVRIEFLVTGEYPGDGKPKPVAFPPPDDCGMEIEGMQFLRLATLIELKLASGTARGRRRDLADVQELIRTLDLPEDFTEQLDRSVRELYLELWAELHG